MTRWTLALFPDGRGILATEEPLGIDELEHARRVFDGWRERQTSDVLIVTDCAVRLIEDIELELPA